MKLPQARSQLIQPLEFMKGQSQQELKVSAPSEVATSQRSYCHLQKCYPVSKILVILQKGNLLRDNVSASQVSTAS